MKIEQQQFTNFELTRDSRGVVTVSLDVPGRSMNVFTNTVLDEMEDIVAELEQTRAAAGVVIFKSGKESGFLAGVDVGSIQALSHAEEAEAMVVRGQSLFRRISELRTTTVAVIHGPCMGGGLELALACDHRLARDNSSTQLGLPEIKLGLIPGWGGTQRLPSLVGLSTTLKMILTGASLSAREAQRVGLVDRAFTAEEWQRGTEAFLGELIENGGRRKAGKRRSLRQRVEATAVVRNLVLRSAERKVRSKARNYPALTAAIRAIRASYGDPVAGYRTERDEFTELIKTPTATALVNLFLARERARTPRTWVADETRLTGEPIRTVGVVGAGVMGAGIAQFAAYRGFKVRVCEVDQEAASAGRKRIASLFQAAANRKGWDQQQVAAAIESVPVTCDFTSLADCDLVIEAVVEDRQVKQRVFESLDRVVGSGAILATNTSSLTLDSFTEGLKRNERVAGLHFFNPVHRMELVEVVEAERTGKQTTANLVSFVRALGKTPVVTCDGPGFLVNRVLFPYLGEAVRLVREGFDPTRIDEEVRRFGMPMGPLELFDQVGIDVALHVADSLQDFLGESAAVMDPLKLMVDLNRLGKKSGIGFYHYSNGKRRRPAKLPEAFPRELRPMSFDRFLDDGLTSVQRRMIYPMLAESLRCLEQGVTAGAWAIDLAMVLGTGFAPHTGGPLHLVDAIAPKRVLDNLDRLCAFYGHRFDAPDLLRELVHDRRMVMTPATNPQARGGDHHKASVKPK